MNTLKLIIGIFAIILVITFIASTKYKSGVAIASLAIALVLAYCAYSGQMRWVPVDGFTGGAPVDYVISTGKCDGRALMGKNNITPVTGNYDGLLLKGGLKPNYPVLPGDKVAYHSTVGDAYALSPDPNMVGTYNPVDGKPGSPRQMFMFAYNRSSPDCCPSTFSSDRGCVCMSQVQRDFINMRGNQKHENGNPDF
jgi:hypothetical protein